MVYVARHGVCSGWLSRLAEKIISTTTGESSVDPPKHQEQVSTAIMLYINVTRPVKSRKTLVLFL